MALSLRKLINEKCKDCIYDSLDSGTWRQQVEACTVTLCPLYAARPVSSSKADKTVESVEFQYKTGE